MKNQTFLYFSLGIILIVIYGLFDPARFPFPQCPMRLMTGWLCPGCGSQRAVYHTLHGNFGEAMKLNLLFLPAVGYGFAGLLTSGFSSDKWQKFRNRFYGLHAAYAALMIIIIFWIGRNIL